MMPWREAVETAQDAIENVDDNTIASVERLLAALSTLEPDWYASGSVRWATKRRVYALAVILSMDEGGIDLAGRRHEQTKASEITFLDHLCKHRLLRPDGADRTKATGYINPLPLYRRIVDGDYV